MGRYTWLSALAVVLLLAVPAAAQEFNPVAQGRFQVSAGGGLSSDGFALGVGFGYMVLDGLMPGVRYRYAQTNDDRIDAHFGQHDLNVYMRYYFPLPEHVYPFLLVDGGYTHYRQWGAGVSDLDDGLFSLLGGGGLAFYFSRNFFVEIVLGMRYYIDPPTWSELHTDPSQFEWNFGFGAAF